MEPKTLASPPLAGRFFTTSATWEALKDHQCGSIKVRQLHKQEKRNQDSKRYIVRKGRNAPIVGKGGGDGGDRMLLKCTLIKHTNKKDLLKNKDSRNSEG